MKIKNLVLGIGIVIVYALVLWQGTQAFYPAPEWDDYCDYRSRPAIPLGEGADCTFPDDVETRQSACDDIKGYFQYEYDDKGCVIDGFCDECQINYDEARDSYSRNVFYISLIIGVITFIVGFFILSIEPVGSALIGSGIWAVFYGTVWNWRNFGAISRFVLLLVVLIILILLAVKLNTKRKKGFFEKLGFMKR